MSDNYEFEKAMQSQATDDYSSYVDKQNNGYINDINNGVYTNNSLTLKMDERKSCIQKM